MRGTFWLAAGVAALALQADATEKSFNVAELGAATDGKTPCTTALQQAIDAAGNAGGGVVRFPAGTFLTGPLQLRSGVTLQLDAGATLLGSRNLQDYASPSSDPANPKPVFNHLLHGAGLHHIAIRGAGTIDGNGDAFPDPKEKIRRPHNIYLDQCEDVLVEGIRLRNAGSWMQQYKLCTNVVIRGIAVFNHVTHNNDGLDINSCMNVQITDCVVDADDDAFCLKSTSGVPCRNVRISGCTASSHCNALKLGTESGGGFLDIAIAHCTVFSPTNSQAINGNQRGEAGIALEIVDGGKMENVSVTDVHISGVLAPIFLRLGDRGRTYGRPQRPGVGTMHNILLKNITAVNCSPLGCAIAGLPGHPIEDVRLENISLGFEGGAQELEYVHKVFQRRVGNAGGADPAGTRRLIGERPEAYPDCRMFGILPAYGFYCRHVKGLLIDNLKLHTAAADTRHAVRFDDVETVAVRGLDVAGAPGGAALLRLVQARDVQLGGIAVRTPADVLLELEGAQTRKIVLQQGAVQGVKQLSIAAPGVPADAFVRKP